MVESDGGIEKVAVEYFQDLFSTSIPTDMDASLRFIKNKVSATTNDTLTAEPTEQEIKKLYLILTQIKPRTRWYDE